MTDHAVRFKARHKRDTKALNASRVHKLSTTFSYIDIMYCVAMRYITCLYVSCNFGQKCRIACN